MGEKVKGRVKPKRRRKLLRYLRQSKGVSMGSLRQVSALRGRVYLLVRIRATWRAISTQLVFPLRVELGKYGIENEGGEVQVGTIYNIIPPKTFLGWNPPGNSASLLYSHSLCSHLIQSLLMPGQRSEQPPVLPSILLMCPFHALQKCSLDPWTGIRASTARAW